MSNLSNIAQSVTYDSDNYDTDNYNFDDRNKAHYEDNANEKEH